MFAEGDFETFAAVVFSLALVWASLLLIRG